ncbi:ribulose-phosphate 3-epimerase [Lactiplantibacillus nangangensis]|uniref:Ribulose-phosphate 3-epimerase n=1 Tax=Lactiplantibacillus nangangensis TaxID=2559917 RepID=A0ABW1SHK5_9LACO|nr:ribulose-phosphate 3-epimerase [Lactiplantibacillus nangangensis]
MHKLLCPSMMVADFTKIKEEVQELELANIDIFHMDIMDGSFVPNMALGVEDYKAIRSLTSKKMDVHLMVQRPKNYIKMFFNLGANIIYIHPESDQMPTSTLEMIKSLGMTPGIAINPGTSIESIEPLLNLTQNVLVMTVNPGFAGQPYLDFVNKKIDALVKLQNQYNYQIFVDGAISPQKVKMLSQRGVTGFILGTSSLFNKDKGYSQIIQELRQL